MKVAFRHEEQARDNLRLYLRFDPTVNGNGGGGSGNGGADSASDGYVHRPPGAGRVRPEHGRRTRSTATTRSRFTQPSTRPSRTPPTASPGPPATGSTQLDTSHALTTSYTSASNGNVVQTARVTGGKKTRRRRASTSPSRSASAASQAQRRADGRARARRQVRPGARRLGEGLGGLRQAAQRPDRRSCRESRGSAPTSCDASYFVNANVLKASEDKTFPGAIVASMTSPWGQAISAGDPANTYFGSYREVFARDLYEIWTGLMADGDHATARDATLFLFNRQQQADGSMPRNSLVNGKTAPDSFGTQLDETSYPLLMADELHLTDPSLYANHIKPAANFVASHGPAFGVERWEEQDGYSPSTIAAEIAGLVAAADLADANHDPGLGGRVARRRRRLPAFDQGLDGDDHRPARTALLHPPLEDRRPERRDLVQRRERRPDARPALGDRRRVPRARAARRAARRPTRTFSRRCPSWTRRSAPNTASGPGWHRYNGDGYGDRSSDGRPWAPSGVGTGHLWPALVVRARRAVAADRRRGRRSVPARRHGPIRRRRRPHPGAGLGEPRTSPPSPFGTPPDTASIGFVERRARRLCRPAQLVGRVVRPAVRRHRRGPPRSTGRRARSSATSRTRRGRRRSR